MGRFSPAAPDCIKERAAGSKVDRIIVHAMDGTLKGTESWFRMTGAQRAAAGGSSVPTAAHYLIGRDGEIVQMVPDDKKAIHAGSTIEGGWNDRSIGIEHEVEETTGKHFPRNDWTDAMLAASAKVTAVLCKKFGIPADRQHVIGHCEVPHRPTDSFHVDPGPAFPWDRYMALVKAELAA